MPVKKIALVWFKTNLRLSDNECLFRALAENDEVIPFYCLDDQLLQTTKFGFKKAGDFRLNFLKENLLQLDDELRKAGSGVMLLHGTPEKEILKLANKYSAQSIYSEKEVAPEELQTAKKTSVELATIGCKFLTFECRNLFHTADLPFPVSKLPDIFTEFRKKVEKVAIIRPLFANPLSIASPPVEALNLTLLAELLPSNVQTDPRAALPPAFGTETAHQRLQYYFYETKALSAYKETRNGLVGERYSTKFSAWLAMGCISAKEIYYEIKTYEDLHGANESTYWLFFELLWRDYFGFCVEKNLLRYFGGSGKQQAKVTAPEVIDTDALNKWINGQTGESFIDANMNELRLTGFMSNRGRQNVASYLCNDLKLDWRYGAAYFEQQLVDYDVCSNWGNWAYVAGVGNDPRANRYFNIAKQAAAYDADGRYRQLWTAEI